MKMEMYGYGESAVYNETLLKHKNIINILAEDENIFNVMFREDLGIYQIHERCDDYFTTFLNHEMCMQLSEMFGDIAKDIADTKK